MTALKLASKLRFDRMDDGTWEAILWVFNQSGQGMYALLGKDPKQSFWTVELVEDHRAEGKPIFAGSFRDCKRFVRLMWESLRSVEFSYYYPDPFYRS